ALIGFESKNKFTVKNSLGQKVFYAAEQSDCCTRNCCGPWRPFGMKILDNFKNEVIHLERPLACDSCWFPCCLQKMEVYAPPGCLVGTVEQDWSILAPAFSIKNAAGDTVLRIEGPVCTMSICGSDVEFNLPSEKQEPGKQQFQPMARIETQELTLAYIHCQRHINNSSQKKKEFTHKTIPIKRRNWWEVYQIPKNIRKPN
ncbi:hypothetical protein J6590_102237, partial [Homalodisca vitripennis]